MNTQHPAFPLIILIAFIIVLLGLIIKSVMVVGQQLDKRYGQQVYIQTLKTDLVIQRLISGELIKDIRNTNH